MIRHLAAIALVATLAACKPQTPATTTAPATTAGTAATQPTEDSAMAEQRRAAAAAEVADINRAAAGPEAIEGTDYVVIPNGQPYQPLDGKIEVVEVFNYVCPACARFNPLVGAWHKQLPADVRFTMVPASFGGTWEPYARAFLVAEQTPGLVDKTHDAIFDAIHLNQTLKGERGVDSDETIAAFYAGHGADAKQFAEQMRSFGVESGLQRAQQFIARSFVGDTASTPTVIVNGKYRVKGKTYPDVLRIATQLIAKERAAAAP